MRDKLDVHTEHCCILHGCKYGDEDCTVERAQKLQSYTCPDCETEQYERAVARYNELHKQLPVLEQLREAKQHISALVREMERNTEEWSVVDTIAGLQRTITQLEFILNKGLDNE